MKKQSTPKQWIEGKTKVAGQYYGVPFTGTITKSRYDGIIVSLDAPIFLFSETRNEVLIDNFESFPYETFAEAVR